VQRASPNSPLDVCFRITRLGESGVSRDGDESVKRRIKTFYPG
jgi:hypothetical protein